MEDERIRKPRRHGKPTGPTPGPRHIAPPSLAVCFRCGCTRPPQMMTWVRLEGRLTLLCGTCNDARFIVVS